ncbi:unnamed protein product [Sphagnum jensenii]|uniref:Uncharacterized protein n=1 Tax=Sphagnum jensenii TaxID=128206 RepID=A0ABP0VP64_9BRYO
MVTNPERQIGVLLTSDEDFRMQLEGHAVIHPSCNTLKNICACSKMFGNSIQGLGRSHPNQQKEQQLFQLPSAEIKLIVHQSSAELFLAITCSGTIE